MPRPARSGTSSFAWTRPIFHYLDETSADLVSEFDNVVVLRTFSKLGGLATLRIGYALGHPDIISALGKAKSSFEVNGVAVAMATALLKDPDIMEAQLEIVARGKDWLLEKICGRRASPACRDMRTSC